MRYFLVLVAVNFMWAFQFSGVKFATERLGPATVVFVTMALSTLLLAPFCKFEKPRPRAEGQKSPAFLLAVLGAGAVVSQIGMTWGVERSLASNAAVLNLTIPVLTALLASFILSERMTWLRWLSFALALCGVGIVSGNDLRSADFTQYGFGNALILVGCLGSAFYNTFSKKVLEYYGPIRVLVYSFTWATLMLAPIAYFADRPQLAHFLDLRWEAWSSLLAIAVFSLSVSMLLYLWVIDKIDVTQASLTIYLLPVFGVLISSLTLDERVTRQLIAGAVLVFVSTFLVTTYEERQKAAG